ncbi:MAG: glycosyltransferase [Planctomycetota bacterium]
MSGPVIGHVVHRLAFAGAEVLARDLARRLEPAGLGFVFLCLDEAGPMAGAVREDGFAVVPLHRRPGIDVALPGRIAAAVRQHGVTLLHAHQYTPFFYASLARRFSRRPPILFTEHGRHYPDLRKPKRVFANRYLLGKPDRVTAVGQFVRHALHDNEGIARGRVDVIHNGIDPDRFDPGAHGTDERQGARDAAREAIREAARDAGKPAYDINDDTPIVVQVARFHPVKDHATAVHAFALAHDRHPDARLVLIGDGDERGAVEQAAWDAGVSIHTVFMGVRDDVDQLIPGADVFLLSSLSEGISVTLLEAMAARLPIVATDVGGNAEVVEHGRTGLLAPRQDGRGLADALDRLLADADRRTAMGDAGRARCLSHFHRDRMHRDYEAVYRAMLDGPR